MCMWGGGGRQNSREVMETEVGRDLQRWQGRNGGWKWGGIKMRKDNSDDRGGLVKEEG